jgi:murein DD-endopeptidase MepM/ murein hydrolase activator NlpD
MGNTGASAGRHLHFEIVEGKTHRWDLNGKGFVSPIAFVEAVMAFEKLKASAKDLSPEDQVSTTRPSLDADKLAAKPKPGKGAKLVNPVPGFGGTAPKKAKKTK